MTTNKVIERYGKPNITGEGYLTTIKLPYPMRIAWDTDRQIFTMRCHKLVANNFVAVFNDILSEYGIKKIKELGIDLYGGCFNYRNKRSGSIPSKHSWGIAIDLDPARNPLKASKRTAQFAKPEYSDMIECFYKNGFISLGKEKDYDWMHFEIK